MTAMNSQLIHDENGIIMIVINILKPTLLHPYCTFRSRDNLLINSLPYAFRQGRGRMDHVVAVRQVCE